MSKREDALEIIKSLGLPRQQQNERSCLTLLALAGLKENAPWSKTQRPLLRIWDIMGWMRNHYGKDYAATIYEKLGIDRQRPVYTSSNRPVYFAHGGEPIRELM